jgi:mannitol/fructose-specific phosphotransferase system IIA component (Ntr-type)
MHVADRLAAQSGGEVVVLKMVGTQATPEEMQSHRDYHYQLRRLAQTDVKSLIVRTDDQKASLGEITQKFDLLLLGAPPEQAFRNLFLGSREQRIAEAAQCSVLSLKTPRHRVHARLEPPTGTGDERFELAPFISLAAVGVRLKGARKEDAFKAMAGRLAEMVQVGTARSIEAALWERERRQSTALTGGVALMSATCASVDSMVMGIFTLEQSVDFRGKGSERVDVCLVTVAPPAERQTQLWMLARLARMTIRPGFLTSLRKSRNATELRNAIRQADQQVDLV